MTQLTIDLPNVTDAQAADIRETLAGLLYGEDFQHFTVEDWTVNLPKVRPAAEYVSSYWSDDEEQFPAVLKCPVCASTGIHEVDSAVRWTEVEYGVCDDPDAVSVYYDSGADFESDHLQCEKGHELAYPANWSEIVSMG
jgi:hypothetical protein